VLLRPRYDERGLAARVLPIAVLAREVPRSDDLVTDDRTLRVATRRSPSRREDCRYALTSVVLLNGVAPPDLYLDLNGSGRA
jgi:hypothetical protein